MKNYFYIKINRARVSASLFEYPCEPVNRLRLNDRKICVYGNYNVWKKELEKRFKETYSECICTDDVKDCTDIIILPSKYVASDDDSQLYFEELFYYQNTALECFYNNQNRLKNLIFILPEDSDVCSTNYKRMADYATLCFSDGLSKRYVSQGIHTYTLLIDESAGIDKFWDTLLFCLSKNSNHIVGKTLKLK